MPRLLSTTRPLTGLPGLHGLCVPTRLSGLLILAGLAGLPRLTVLARVLGWFVLAGLPGLTVLCVPPRRLPALALLPTRAGLSIPDHTRRGRRVPGPRRLLR
jgi:hypothetical protein